MKDIDFDELDRAVSSLMNDVPQSEPVKNDDVKTVTLSSDEPVESSGATDVPAVTSDASPTDISEQSVNSSATERPKLAAAPAPAMPAARRGRFMDMVRSPSREARAPMASTSVSRHSTVLQPVTPARPPIVGNPIRTETTMQNDSAPAFDVALASGQMVPDKAVEGSEGHDTPVIAPDSSFTEKTSDQPPMASPFLPDAKVEKRPLGRPADPAEFENASSNDEISMTPAGIVSDNLSPNPDAQLPEQPLPAELDSKLLDIETSTASLPGESTASSPVPVKSNSGPSSPSAGANKSLSSASIPQQYKVQPKVADANASGTIYDTASYHQPLAHPPKKKPGWLWVVTIIVILLLGAAGGAVAYYLGLV